MSAEGRIRGNMSAEGRIKGNMSAEGHIKGNKPVCHITEAFYRLEISHIEA